MPEYKFNLGDRAKFKGDRDSHKNFARYDSNLLIIGRYCFEELGNPGGINMYRIRTSAVTDVNLRLIDIQEDELMTYKEFIEREHWEQIDEEESREKLRDLRDVRKNWMKELGQKIVSMNGTLSDDQKFINYVAKLEDGTEAKKSVEVGTPQIFKKD